MSKETKKSQSQFMDTFKRLCRNKTAVIGLIIVIALALIALLSPVFYDYDTLVTVIVALSGGLVLGAAAGYYGGKVDMIIMRIMDIFLAVPGTLLAICIVASLGNSIMNLVIAQAVSSIPSFSRVVRGAVITARDAEYVEAARAIGAKDARIIFKDVLPNSLAPIIVQTTLQVASVILSIAGLSFIGLGIPAPRPEWGAMLSASRAYIRDYSYMCLFPGLAIMTTILSLNLLGDGLRDALDPRLR